MPASNKVTNPAMVKKFILEKVIGLVIVPELVDRPAMLAELLLKSGRVKVW